MNNYLGKFFYFFIFSLLLIIDQASKYFIRIRGGFYICNQNLAFSFYLPSSLFWISWFLIIFWIIWILYKRYLGTDSLYGIIILAGAGANIIDRLRYGCVIDFINLHFWPVFNLADVFITSGVLILVFKLFKKYFYAK
jgi:signal peptidase II